MAAVKLKWTLFVILPILCIVLTTINAGNDFVAYKVKDADFASLRSLSHQRLKFVLLQRQKRYVETAIPRLADNYFRPESSRNLDKDDLDSFSKRRGRMEMLGNLAVNTDQLAATASFSSEDHRAVVDENVPDKPTKKPTSIATKKAIELNKSTALNQDLNVNVPRNATVVDSTTISTAAVTKTSATSASTPTASSPEHNVTNAAVAPVQNSSSASSVHHADDTQQTADATHNDYSGNGGVTTADFAEDDFPKDITNNTLVKNNITEKQVDKHIYYNKTFIMDPAVAKHYWVDMDAKKEVIVNHMLSKSHRRAATVRLSFEFPFYGHMVQSVTIATGGFLYTGDYIHSWLAATQYIAPLMANFDTGISPDSQVRYADNGTSFTVEWDRVHLQDRKDVGQFTFQATLHKNGDIVFVYKDVPISVSHIEDKQHPVKVGLSDAYIIDRTVFFVRRKTIYEYHRVNCKREDIKNWTVIYMAALPTCHSYTDCNSCLSKDTTFDCKWCPVVNRCSSGYDRNRQEWQLHQCDHIALNSSSGCDAAVNSSAMISERHQDGTSVNHLDHTDHVANSQAATDVKMENSQKATNIGHSGLLGLLFCILSISGVSLWILYAYRNPHTTSGQVLIKYRPSQWTLRRGEARYTAASIHM